MRYIGCKRRLLPFIHATMNKYQITGDTFCDLFSGTATVGHYFKQQDYQIFSCDLLYSSYIQQYVKLKINKMPEFNNLLNHLDFHKASDIMIYLNNINGVEDFTYHNYSLGGTKNKLIQRIYFTDDNAKKIDAIRNLLDSWYQLELLNQDEFYILLYALLNAVSSCDNTTGKQTGFLKHFSTNAKRHLQLKFPNITASKSHHYIYCQNSVELIQQLPEMDILYLDPPYTATQYGAAYHLLETIARWDTPHIYGTLGNRCYQSVKSNFCSRKKCLNDLHTILQQSNFKHLLLSYSDHGILTIDQIADCLSQYGHLQVNCHYLSAYQSSSKAINKNVTEYLFYLQPKCSSHVFLQHPTFNLSTKSI